MAGFHPFKGIRATQDKMHLVASRSFLSYSDIELNDKLKGNPFTFLHVIQPTQNREVAEQIKFQEVRKNFDEFVEQGVLIQEERPSFYLYRQIKNGKSFLGWMGGIAVEDYRSGVIKIHEHTIEKRENLFAEYLAITGINAEPVLMFSSYSPNFKKWTQALQDRVALSDFTTTDKVRHTLWVIKDAEELERIQEEFQKFDSVYIADGHHRSASSERLQRQHPEWEEAKYFLSYVIDQADLTIHPFHRMISDERMEDGIIDSFLNDNFIRVEEARDLPLKGEFGWRNASGTSYWKFKEEKGLDPEKLAHQVLGPLLEVQDFRKDKRIKYCEGPKGMAFIDESIAKQKIQSAFLLSSVTTEELCEVADQGGVMPPKSTYIEPKLRSGLVIYPINYGF
ncbi:MAG: hypothetical protein RL521_1186 [Bacteroidota bacterium]